MGDTRGYASMTPEERRRKNAQGEAWNKENTKQIKCRFNLRTDADILEKLESMDNVQGYIKELIRADIARSAAPSDAAGSSESAD